MPKADGARRLYFGTTERMAKVAPVAGLGPAHGPIYLTDVYPGYFAFYATTNEDEKYGLIEVDGHMLDRKLFLPCEWFLDQSVRRKKKEPSEHRRLESYRKKLDEYRDQWKQSLKEIGVCVYVGPIPKKAIRRVTIYNPHLNPIITRSIVNTRLNMKEHRANYARNRVLTRWLMGEEVALVDWVVDPDDEDQQDKEKLTELLQSKRGLEVFYHGPGKTD